MSYQELVEKLFQINRFHSQKMGLKNCMDLDKIFDHPHTSFEVIHVAGTNGKGSVATKIAKTLELAGYKVGLFTSPHLFSFCERVQINSKAMEKEEVVKWLKLLFHCIHTHGIPATFFEITTYLAYLYFRQEKVDYAVLETGLGGRLDATNLVTPLLSIITSISLDHTEVLGHTIEEIAIEKAGIIKEGRPVVIGPTVPFHVVNQYARSLNSVCIQVKRKEETAEEENQAIALQALNTLGSIIKIPDIAMELGVKKMPPCRFEVISLEPHILLDVAHNPAGLTALFQTIKLLFPFKKFRVLFALSKNKDVKACLKVLADQKVPLYPVESDNGYCFSSEKICLLLEQLNVAPEQLIRYSSIKETLVQATLDLQEEQELLVICGTFYIMDEIKKALQSIVK